MSYPLDFFVFALHFYKFPASASPKRQASNNRPISCTVKRIRSWRKHSECTKQRTCQVTRRNETTLNVRDFSHKKSLCTDVCDPQMTNNTHSILFGTCEFPSNQMKIISKKLNAFARMKSINDDRKCSTCSFFSFYSHEMFYVKWQIQFVLWSATRGECCEHVAEEWGNMKCWNPLDLLYDFGGNCKRYAEEKWA